ncbi:MAG: protein-glutamate O-methyltransferase CheR [Oligoflexia bacterium]|nr:protein-glutamate O-methyltransferase CheR [Oligoflexia bacterium]
MNKIHNVGNEEIEINLLLEAIYQKYGYDFRNYSRPSLTRRIGNFLQNSKYQSIAEIIPDLLDDVTVLKNMINAISVTVTEMYRDPDFFKETREKIFPYLKSYPRINIWHAGCATGEEVYSFAIMLFEEQLYDRCNIYATDMNEQSVNIAKEAIFPIDIIKIGTENYRKAGGKHSFTDYYYSKFDRVIIDNNLKNNITFSTHNLVTDGCFNQMHIILCRNVLIYFNKDLQDQVLQLLTKSLLYNGIFCLGPKESIDFSSVSNDFETLSKINKIYKKTKAR